MTMRLAYERELAALREGIVTMSSMVDKAIARSMDAFKNQDLPLARSVIEADAKINAIRWKLEDEALTIIATQAPMAGDLRWIAACLHIVTDLERMADHAAGNAKILLETSDEPLLKPLVDIPRMADIAREMLSDAISAFIHYDAEAARAIVRRDDEIDNLYNQVYRELLTFMMSDPRTISRATHLLWASHNVERIGDRTTNICEQVVYVVEGRLEDIEVSDF
ncbi:MAG: phosphate signaling complex protein PhoU [Thermomicrobiales bacterium]|nr:phosphate signaling complex protein PhoU [Thermomicrobiales bacterium]